MIRTAIKIISAAGLVGALLASCEKELPLYDNPQARLNFSYKYDTGSDSVISYSFVYHGSVTHDTVWLELSTMGFLSDHNRTFELQQQPMGNDAVPGRHYISFDDADYKARYLVVPAGQVKVQVPVIVLRDASLASTEVNLRILVRDNENFVSGYRENGFKIIRITDRLTKPDAWNSYMNYYFGEYGTRKHQFMITVTGEKWDDDYINSHISDFGYITYLKSKLRKALNEENERRTAAGLPLFAEDDGTLINFGTW